MLIPVERINLPRRGRNPARKPETEPPMLFFVLSGLLYQLLNVNMAKAGFFFAFNCRSTTRAS
jgi:hypothetical protein